MASLPACRIRDIRIDTCNPLLAAFSLARHTTGHARLDRVAPAGVADYWRTGHSGFPREAGAPSALKPGALNLTSDKT
jgi:hypothetical protein